MVLSETRGLRLFGVIRGSIGLKSRLSGRWHTEPNNLLDTFLEPERLKNPLAIHLHDRSGIAWAFARDAQAACVFVFSFAASKCSPFFQSTNVIAAILRASVSRAMAGLVGLATRAV
jgi:hypothetical protein